jgi:hypothetical protein
MAAALAAAAVLFGGCGDQEKIVGINHGGGGGGPSYVPGTDPETDWPTVSDAAKQFDARLVTDGDTVWADANKSVGSWKFRRPVTVDGDKMAAEATRQYIGMAADTAYNWFTVGSRLCIETRSAPSVRMIYQYQISQGGELTLTGRLEGDKVTFSRTVTGDVSAGRPSHAGHDPRFQLDEGVSWVNYSKGTGLAVWNLKTQTCYENWDGATECYDNVYAQTARYGAGNRYEINIYNYWYTTGNNQLHLEDILGNTVTYRYTFAGDAVTIVGNGVNTAFRRLHEDQLTSLVTPEFPAYSHHDPKLGLDAEGGWYDESSTALWFGTQTVYYYYDIYNKGTCWWYATRDPSGDGLYFIDYITHEMFKQYTYRVVGDMLELTDLSDGRKIELWWYGAESGDDGSAAALPPLAKRGNFLPGR